MLKYVCLIAICLVTLTTSQHPHHYHVEPVKKLPKDVVVREHTDNDGSGKFYSFRETLDGAWHEQIGYLEANPDPYGKPTQVIQGRYLEITPEGPKMVSYIADRTGYHPVGDHIPKA